MFQPEYLKFAQDLLRCVNLEIAEIPPPYDQASMFDHGLRRLLRDEKRPFHDSVAEYEQIEAGRLHSIHSRLGYVTVFFRLPQEEGGAILFFGPFLQETATDAFIRKVMKENRISERLRDMLRLYYSELPVLLESTVLQIARDVLARCAPGMPEKEISRFVFSGDRGEELQAMPTPAHEFSMTLSEQVYQSRRRLLHAVRDGKIREAVACLENYVQTSGLFQGDNVTRLRRELLTFNAICECVVRDKSVHPLYRDLLNRELTARIEQKISPAQLRAMPLHIVEQYCALVVNHGFSAYSSLVQQAVDYIDLNVEENVTLRMLAQHLRCNASYLSARFKRETGLTVTQYVHARKVEQAAWLLSSSGISVQQAALQVGFSDAGYFSRLFKAQFGVSPQHYSKRSRA